VRIRENNDWGFAEIFKELIKMRKVLRYERINEQLNRMCGISQMVRKLWRVQKENHLRWNWINWEGSRSKQRQKKDEIFWLEKCNF